jgi:hypothetical protein
VTVRLHLQRRFAERFARLGGQQDLSAPSQRHDAAGGRLGNAVDLERLGAERDVGGAVFAQDHVTDVKARA